MCHYKKTHDRRLEENGPYPFVYQGKTTEPLSQRSTRAFFYKKVVHSTSNPLVERSIIVVLSIHLFSLLSRKKRENEFGGVRAPDFFCLFMTVKPLSHSVSAD